MDEERTTTVDRRGTVWDWPAALIVCAVIVVFASGGALIPLGLLMTVFAGVAWLARRGTFSARK